MGRLQLAGQDALQAATGAGIAVGALKGLKGKAGQGRKEQRQGVVRNSRGEPYPIIIDPRTGEPIPAPKEKLTRVPVEKRSPWDKEHRAAYIKEWYDRGYKTPEGGWIKYDIHHIRPREYGGSNDFDNLVPIERDLHQKLLNEWWRNYR